MKLLSSHKLFFVALLPTILYPNEPFCLLSGTYVRITFDTNCFFFPQYNLDFQGLSTRSGAFGDRGEDGSGAGSGGEGGKLSGGSGSDGSM